MIAAVANSHNFQKDFTTRGLQAIMDAAATQRFVFDINVL